MRSGENGYRFADTEKIGTEYNEAVKNGALNPDKVNLRIKQLAEDYEARKEKRKEKLQKNADQDPSVMFLADFEALSRKLNDAKTIEEKKDIADKVTELLTDVLSVESAKRKMAAVEVSSNN